MQPSWYLCLCLGAAALAAMARTGESTFSNQFRNPCQTSDSSSSNFAAACILSCSVSDRLCRSCCRKNRPGWEPQTTGGTDTTTSATVGSTDDDLIDAQQAVNTRRASECLAACIKYKASEVRRVINREANAEPSAAEVAKALAEVTQSEEYWMLRLESGRPASLLRDCRDKLAEC